MSHDLNKVSLKVPGNLIYAAFFFIDIVGLSNPTISTTTQTKKIKILNQSITKCNTFRSVSKDELLVLPTGDGMVIGFKNGLEQPLNLAKEVHDKLNEYNKEKVTSDKILVRIGCHSGNVFFVEDVYGNLNIWGPGTILARRVMDLGDASHILMTSNMAEALLELSNEYTKIIHPLHDYKIKYAQTLLIYSIYGPNFGNPNRPSKGLVVEDKLMKETISMKKTISYKNVEFNLTLKDPKTNLVKHRRIFHFVNKSDEPLYEILTGIITNVEKKFLELNVKAYDEKNDELSVNGINVDSPFRKEFTLRLNSPVFKGDKGRYSVEYVVEEPKKYYENLFLINSDNLTVTFNFPTDSIKHPKLYAIEKTSREKKLLDMDPDIKKGVRTQVKWKKIDGILEKDLIRLEW